MKLSRTSRVVRWAYLFNDKIPRQTSLCALFWRTVLLSPLKLAMPVAAVVFLATRFWWYPVASFSVTGALAFLFAMVVVSDKLKARREARQRLEEAGYRQPSVVRDGFRAVKGKVCPIVELT